MIIHNPILTGSFTVNGTDVSSITSSAASLTSLNAYTASQNNRNGTYATTGSNTFAGIQTVNSNLVVTGSITAATLVVQTITSSVDFVTGSTRFGSISANTHQFTGSVSISGSLSGTSATFSAGVVSQGAYTGLQYNSAGAYPAYNTYFGAIGTNFSNSNSELDIWNTVGGGFVFRRQTGASAQTALLTIASTGAATFLSSASGGQNLRLQTSVAAGRNYMQFANGSGDMGYMGYGGADSKFYIINQLNDDMLFYTNSALRMTIASGGNIGIGASINPQNLLEVSAAGGSPRIRLGTLQNNDNTPKFEVITSNGNTVANSAWLKVNDAGGFTLGQSAYTKTGGDSGNFANLSAEVETNSIYVSTANNVLIGTTTDNGQKLQVNGGVSYSGGGLIQSLNDAVSANSTRTYTITGVLAGGIQIMVGAFGNGTGNSSRAFWIGGGYLDSALLYTEVLRVNTGTIVISAITSNTSSSVFTVTNNFGFNSAFVGITIISGGLIGNPTITAS
jgi:hypothetical protein